MRAVRRSQIVRVAADYAARHAAHQRAKCCLVHPGVANAFGPAGVYDAGLERLETALARNRLFLSGAEEVASPGVGLEAELDTGCTEGRIQIGMLSDESSVINRR